MRKDKNYNNTRGAGDGDLTAGLLGMMQGWWCYGVSIYDAKWRIFNKSAKSFTC